MGMFDYIKCEYPLPAYSELQDETFQTKDTFEQYMAQYVITKDGYLMQEITEPKKETLESGTEATIHRPTGKRKRINFHGDLFFYPGLSVEGRYEFRARFTHGVLDTIVVVDGPEVDGPQKRTRTFVFEPNHKTDEKLFYIARNVRKEATTKCPDCGKVLPVFINALSYPVTGVLMQEYTHCDDCCEDVPVHVRLNISVTVVDLVSEDDQELIKNPKD